MQNITAVKAVIRYCFNCCRSMFRAPLTDTFDRYFKSKNENFNDFPLKTTAFNKIHKILQEKLHLNFSELYCF